MRPLGDITVGWKFSARKVPFLCLFPSTLFHGLVLSVLHSLFMYSFSSVLLHVLHFMMRSLPCLCCHQSSNANSNLFAFGGLLQVTGGMSPHQPTWAAEIVHTISTVVHFSTPIDALLKSRLPSIFQEAINRDTPVTTPDTEKRCSNLQARRSKSNGFAFPPLFSVQQVRAEYLLRFHILKLDITFYTQCTVIRSAPLPLRYWPHMKNCYIWVMKSKYNRFIISAPRTAVFSPSSPSPISSKVSQQCGSTNANRIVIWICAYRVAEVLENNTYQRANTSKVILNCNCSTPY